MYCSRDIISFDVLEKGLLGVVSPTHFSMIFQEKCFSSYILLTYQDFIAWWPLLLEIWVNTCIVIICFADSDVIDFEVNLIFLIKPFPYMAKKSRQKFKCLENEKSWNEKKFLTFLKSFHVSKIVSDFRLRL